MGLSKPIIIQDSSVDISNLATKSDIDSIKNSVGAVKKIQRGTTNIPSNSEKVEVTLSGFSNLDKMVVYIDGSAKYGNNSDKVYSPWLKSLSLTSATFSNVTSTSVAGYEFSYQVVEYY